MSINQYSLSLGKAYANWVGATDRGRSELHFGGVRVHHVRTESSPGKPECGTHFAQQLTGLVGERGRNDVSCHGCSPGALLMALRTSSAMDP